MSTVLVATDSVHTTAAACDYLDPRLTSEDTVAVLSVPTAEVSERDAGDAANVARTRLIEPTVEILAPPDDDTGKTEAVATLISRVADDHGVSEIIVGSHRGDPETAGTPPGSTVRELLAGTSRPVVVVPV